MKVEFLTTLVTQAVNLLGLPFRPAEYSYVIVQAVTQSHKALVDDRR